MGGGGRMAPLLFAGGWGVREGDLPPPAQKFKS